MLAADMTPREGKIFAQEIDQCFARIHALADTLAIDSQGKIEGVATRDPASIIAWPRGGQHTGEMLF
jgi:hypothetical protein